MTRTTENKSVRAAENKALGTATTEAEAEVPTEAEASTPAVAETTEKPDGVALRSSQYFERRVPGDVFHVPEAEADRLVAGGYATRV